MLSNKDKQILQHILTYCDDIEYILQQYNHDKDVFYENRAFQLASAMALLQIGELVKKLSEDFVQADRDVPWKLMKGMRDILAHDYISFNEEIAWSTITENIPQLKNHITRDLLV